MEEALSSYVVCDLLLEEVHMSPDGYINKWIHIHMLTNLE